SRYICVKRNKTLSSISFRIPCTAFLVCWLVADTSQLTTHDKMERLAGSGGVVRIGHLLPNNPNIAHEPEVLKMCAQDLKQRKILPINYTLQVITMESCNKYSGVEHAAYLHYIKNATIYFGPGCNNGEFYVFWRPLLNRAQYSIYGE
ncbi:hypothetical protein OSTOST_02018, partial [Ostertagia ostertagi]